MFLYLTGTNVTYQISDEQPANARNLIRAIEYNPASNNRPQEYFGIGNSNNYPVDISGWKLSGGADFTFAPGTVIGTANHLYVSPDVMPFRARSIHPLPAKPLPRCFPERRSPKCRCAARRPFAA